MATAYYPGCPTGELPFYVCDPCEDYEPSKIRSVGFVTDAYYATLILTPTSTASWVAGIESEDIIIIPRVIGSLDAPDPETSAGYGDATETILPRLYTAAWRDPNYKDNCNFYNTLKTKTGTYHFIYRTGTQTHITPEVVTIDTRAPITENDQEFVEWNGSVRWRSRVQPCPFDTPADIFECFALQA